MKVINYKYFDLYLDENKRVVKIVVTRSCVELLAIKDAIKLLQLRKEDREVPFIVQNKEITIKATDTFEEATDRILLATPNVEL